MIRTGTMHKLALLFAMILFMTGCLTIRPESKAKLDEAQVYGLPNDKVQRADQTTAGLLNILPGIGNIYVAVKSEHQKALNWILFPVNLLTWPLSIAWGIPQAAKDAGRINQQATADYYMNDKTGQAEFAAAKDAFQKK